MSYEAIQQSVRAATGTTGTYEEDWIALFEAAGIAAGFFNDRLLAWINTALGSSYAFLPDAMRAMALEDGVSRWGEIGGVGISTTPNIAWGGIPMQFGALKFLKWGS